MAHQIIKKIVEEILEEDEQARDNDTWLIIQVIRKMGFKIYVDYSDLDKLPKFETIRRHRQHIQNDHHRFLPTDKAPQSRTKADTTGLMVNSQLDY